MTTEKLESILELAELLSRQNDFNEILRLITSKAAVMLEAETALIMMVNPVTRETVKTLYREGSGQQDSRLKLFHAYLTGWVIEQDKGFYTGNLAKDPRFNREMVCLLYTSPSPRDRTRSRMPSSA